MRVSVSVNGADVKVLKPSLKLDSRLGNRISTGSFDFLGEDRWASPSFAIALIPAMGGYTHPYGKDEVKIDRGPTPMQNCAISLTPALGGNSTYLDHFFGGYIATKEIRLIGRRRFYRCTAQDYNILITQKLVTKSYIDKTEQEIIDDLFSTYLPEIDTSTYVESSGATVTIDWTRAYLNETLEELANIFDKEWFIDYEKKLHYFTPSTDEAPFELSSSPSLTTKQMYNNFEHTEDDSKIINKMIVVGDPDVPIVVTRQSDESYAKYREWFEGKIVDRNIDTEAWAILRGDAELAESAFGKVDGRFTCYQEGLVIGQKVKIYNYLRNIDSYFLVRSVRLSMLSNFLERVDIEYE